MKIYNKKTFWYGTVSYTHLDVYKRQILPRVEEFILIP